MKSLRVFDVLALPALAGREALEYSAQSLGLKAGWWCTCHSVAASSKRWAK